MRTTVRLPDDLLAEAKKRAAERGTTLTQLFEEALREALARHREADSPSRDRVCLTTVDGSGLQPGVDLDDSAALLDVMEGGDGPP